nr:hypothetical protein [uncultured Draconibacterium sp.]
MKNFKLGVVTLAILTLLFSCEKEEIRQSETIEPHQIVMNEAPETIRVGQQLGGLKSGSVDYYNDLDWENTDYLDINYKGYPKRIYLPCAHTAVALTYADQTSRFDVRKEDGWRLLYNLIPTNSNDPARVLVFFLYNKYRGKMKVFFYNAQDINTNGNVMGILGVTTGNTEAFNFSSVIANPVRRNVECVVSQSSYQNVNHYGIGVMPNHWYVFEYDMSNYDPSIDYTRELAFHVYGVDLTALQLEGATTGTITGQLTKVINSSNDANSLIKNKELKGAIGDGTTSLLTKVGKDNLPDVFSKLKSKTSSSVLKFVFGKLGSESTIENIAGVIGGGFAGIVAKPVSKLIGKLFPHKNQPTYEVTDVSLKTSLKSAFTGELKTQNSLISYIITPPQSAANSDCYAGKFGVFRIKSTPKVYVQERFTFARLEDDCVVYPSYEDQLFYAQSYLCPMGFTENLSDYRYVQKATLENFSNLIEFNQSLLDDATVEYDASIVVYNSSEKWNMNKLAFENDAEGAILSSDGSVGYGQLIIAPEPIDGVYTFLYNSRPSKFLYQRSPFPPTTSSPNLTYMDPDPGMRVKVTVRITPKNGDSPVVINQLIQPQLIANQTRKPEPVILTNGDFGGGLTPR